VKRLVVATTSAGKIREVSMALSDLADWNVEALNELPNVEETGTTFMENATLKATHYSRFIDGLTLADDSGLCVHALDNRPGVYSARFAGTVTERNTNLLAELRDLGPTADRSATFYCAFVVARGGKTVWSTQTELRGQIAVEPVGEFGFGYDPVFFVPDVGKTMAEMLPSEKNGISARGRALEELRAFLLAS